MTKVLFLLKFMLLLLLVQGCSGNGFHLRNSAVLAPQYSNIQLQGLPEGSGFYTFFTGALAEAGGHIVADEELATSTIVFSKLEEGRRGIAYTRDRRVREYLVYLKVEYSLRQNNKATTTTKNVVSPKKRINIDRSYLYDPDFALGKAEEERRVKQTLYEEATRLILLKLTVR